MKTFNLLIATSIACLALSACGAKEAIESIRPPSGKNGYRVITTPDLSSTNTYNVKLKINGKTYQSGDKIDIATLHQDTVHNQSYEMSAERVGMPGLLEEKGTARIYKNKYSVVLAAHVEKEIQNNISKDADKSKVLAIQGEATELAKLPTRGSFLYAGQAFTGKNDTGRLIYNVDFDRMEGSGTISGLGGYNSISLEKGKIKGFNPNGTFGGKAGIEGKASYGKSSGSYKLGFFGPKAEEIAGQAGLKIEGKDVNIGFGGRKQPGSK
ncbi:factor H binding protein domain-containing protein [Neisseria animaloris]|uniref:factor H binding protein domain-containing protein n=1 Tax=Neisseria animaloris TaxID=326522 RepID=UPI000D3B5F9E|nr:factor H binding protein domain-containing protein [Neisseria animaloris]